MGVTSRDELDHLMDWYSNITASDIKSNEARINEALDNLRPINVFFQCIDDAMQYADNRKNLFTANQILQMAFHSVNATIIYQYAWEEWRQKANAKKTWKKFKGHFAAEYHMIRKQQRISGKAGFNSAHLAHETINTETELENIALAATASCNIFADLISIKKKLVETNTALVE